MGGGENQEKNMYDARLSSKNSKGEKACVDPTCVMQSKMVDFLPYAGQMRYAVRTA